MRLLVCPDCRTNIRADSNSAKCEKGHSFQVIDGIIDIMPKIDDQNLLSEEKYWNDTAEDGWPQSIENLNPYMDGKMFEDYQNVCSEFIKNEWPDYNKKNISIGEIGCGNGSAISYLEKLEFLGANYLGIDISINMMRLARKRPMPANWNIHFVKTSGHECVFRENYFDIMFSISVLHHFDTNKILECISNSLKSNGLLIINEPSARNPFASIGRRLGIGYGIYGFFKNKKKKPLLPQPIREIASKYQLELVYEKGLHFITWPLYYVLLSVKPPKPLAVFAYNISSFIDSFVTSPSLNYCFFQVYKKL
jgi:SAM-dependent methyltransferase